MGEDVLTKHSKPESGITQRSTHNLVIEGLSLTGKDAETLSEISLTRSAASPPPIVPRRAKAGRVTTDSIDVPEGGTELVLHGDIASLTHIFEASNRKSVSTSVPESIYRKLQKLPGGISRFYDDAAAAFDGDLPSLVIAAARFVEERRLGELFGELMLRPDVSEPKLTLIPAKRENCPPPGKVLPVHKKYRPLAGEHPDHPGKGLPLPSSRSRGDKSCRVRQRFSGARSLVRSAASSGAATPLTPI